MPRFLKRLPGFPAEPPGLERRILRAVPRTMVLGTLTLLLPAVLTRFTSDGTAAALKTIASADIFSASLIILHWTVVFTVGLAAFIVMVMKGPGYTADAYPLVEVELDEEQEEPRRPR